MNLTEEQKKNLQVFLARVQLTGAEVGVFNDLVNALFAPESPKKETMGGEPVNEEPKEEAK